MAKIGKYRYEYTDWYGFGKRVNIYRKKLGLTVEQLAEMIDRSENFINRLEKGKKSCSIHTVHQLAQSLRISTDILLYGPISEDKNEYEDKKIIENITNVCNEKELKIIKDLILVVFPKFKDIN